MNTRKKYRSPPIVEAACSFTLADAPWDITRPGLFFTAIRGRYPKAPQEKISMESLSREEEDKTIFSFKQTARRTHFFSEDGLRLATVGKNALSTHVIELYPGWESFKNDINFCRAAYCDALGEPKISSIGLRYINKIEINQQNPNIERYFNIDIGLPAAIPHNFDAILKRVQCSYDDAPIKLNITFSSINGENTFLLDIDLRWSVEEPILISESGTKLENLKERERDIFESLITDNAREIFNE